MFGEDDPAAIAAAAAAGAPVRTSSAPISQTVWTAPAIRAEDARGTPVATGQTPGGDTADELAAVAVAVEPPTAQQALGHIAWRMPTVSMLEERAAVAPGTIDHAANARLIEEKLRSFAIPATVVATNSGPVVTQYEVRPEAHVKVSRIEALADDLAMALAARSIRIEAPIPGKDVVGIEIPNQASEVVGFRPLIDDSAMLEATSPLTFALGRDVSGKAYAVDLAKMPHLLVAGATGSGKSVCVDALITSILMHALPQDVRMILVDLKRVELAPYNGLPHLLQHVIVEPNDAKAVLNWAVHEMEDRYKLLAAHNVRNIAAFNGRPNTGPDERLPYIVLIIDELADLIMREGRKVEDPVVKIAQKARAVGIHLVLATQRPSVQHRHRAHQGQCAVADRLRHGLQHQFADRPRRARRRGPHRPRRHALPAGRSAAAAPTAGRLRERPRGRRGDERWLDQAEGRTYYDEGMLASATGRRERQRRPVRRACRRG